MMMLLRDESIRISKRYRIRNKKFRHEKVKTAFADVSFTNTKKNIELGKFKSEEQRNEKRLRADQ